MFRGLWFSRTVGKGHDWWDIGGEKRLSLCEAEKYLSEGANGRKGFRAGDLRVIVLGCACEEAWECVGQVGRMEKNVGRKAENNVFRGSDEYHLRRNWQASHWNTRKDDNSFIPLTSKK